MKPLDVRNLDQRFTDVLIIGSGVAGLRAALALDPSLKALILTKNKASISSTYDAQGGVAISVGPDDSVKNHVEDTLSLGLGLCKKDVVEFVCSGADEEFHQLLRWGAQFDQVDGQFDLGLEGGHSRRRILHSHGAQTGREIARTLLNEVYRRPNLKVLEDHFLVDLLINERGVVGALILEGKRLLALRSGQVIMASGGLGQIFRETSNPIVATGDGLAASFRAGAALEDMEFIQFHPTTLYIAGAARVLISEAVRGAGGRLIDSGGHTFMDAIDPRGDLASRDIVCRSIMERIRLTQDSKVYLDVRHLKNFAQQFPSLNKMCQDFGVSPAYEPIPVHPAAHYHIGGLKTDLNGQTNLAGLYAVGEVACTGLHGANRLASNSLLEGLVLGHHVGEFVNANFREFSQQSFYWPNRGSRPFYIDVDDMRLSLRHLMWRQVGIVRDSLGLKEASSQLEAWLEILSELAPETPAHWELVNMILISQQITQAALNREESRGVHYRQDFPQTKMASA